MSFKKQVKNILKTALHSKNEIHRLQAVRELALMVLAQEYKN